MKLKKEYYYDVRESASCFSSDHLGSNQFHHVKRFKKRNLLKARGKAIKYYHDRYSWYGALFGDDTGHEDKFSVNVFLVEKSKNFEKAIPVMEPTKDYNLDQGHVMELQVFDQLGLRTSRI